MSKAQQLRKQLEELFELKHAEEEAYRKAKRRHDNLLNKRGVALLEEWGADYLPDLKETIAHAQTNSQSVNYS